VEFFRGSTLIGADTTAPYSINWNNVPQGNYALTAKATAIKKGNPDQMATSSTVNIIVTVPPSVSVTAPVNGATFGAPDFGSSANVPVSATATDSDGTISEVRFDWVNDYDQIYGQTTVNQPPFKAILPMMVGPGCGFTVCEYVITAMAVDNQGADTLSNSVMVRVLKDAPPTVSLANPAPNAAFTAPASINLQAQASDADGTISQVEFYQGASLITTVTSTPYNFTWTGVPQGSYSLTARATDNLGVATTSAPVNITVTASAAKLHFIHPDHLNTPRLIADSTGTTVWRWDQGEPFGNDVPNNDPSGVGAFEFNMRFPGQYFDRETNLAYNSFRDYDSAIARYIESDPIGLRGGINTYVYVRSSPLRLIDPEGLRVQQCCRPAAIAYGLVDHCWIKTDTLAGGMDTRAQCSLPGKDRADPPYSPVVVSDHSCDIPTNCHDMDDIDEDCVNRHIGAFGASLGRFGLFNNCQTFTYDVLVTCSKRKPWDRPKPPKTPPTPPPCCKK